MSRPTEVTDWAVSPDALKEPVPEDRKQTGWVKLSNGFGEKPSIKIYNGWMNLIGRWIAYLKSSQTPVGHIIYSTLNESQFLSTSPFGDWVLCDGRDVQGSAYQTLTNRTDVPDMRAMYPLMLNSELDPIFYSVVDESVARLDSVIKYDKGSITPFDSSDDPYVNFNISSVKMAQYQAGTLQQDSRSLSITRTNSSAGKFFYNQNADINGDSDHKKRWLRDGNLNGVGETKITSGNTAHSHDLNFGNQISSSSNLPNYLYTNQKTNRSASKTVDVSFDDNNRLIPKTYTVNMYIRIN